MDGVVSARTGSVVVCGGHVVQWMAWSVHMLAVWWPGVWWTWGPIDGMVSACDGSVVVCAL